MAPGRALGMTCLLIGTLSGCQWMQRNDFGRPLQANVSKDLLIARINENIHRLHGGWRSDDVNIRFPGMLVGVDASVYVQPARNFRLRATSLRGDEADLGSNDERFWFWIRDAAPQSQVVTVRHEDLPEAQQRLPIPFHTDWLMQVLGVTPLDPGLFSVQPSSDGTWILEARTLAPNGQEVRRLVRIDGKYGLVLGHSLYDGTNNALIARAVLSHHRTHRESGIILPHQIFLEWPQQQMAMTLQIGTVQVNDLHTKGDQIWQLPAGHPVLDLGRTIPAAMRRRTDIQQMGGTSAAPVQYAHLEEPPWSESRRSRVSAPGEPPWADADEPPWSPPASSDDAPWQRPVVRRETL